ncbi:MAG: aminotransferase class I/II-fold pyridoxal phosphate-dependent enzyme [Planctomycetota bacterium]|nr:aminotransferase class I/II-fold pyridoxal phosphate-dependent enzyme [Planctomycetota bacterium]MCX8039078.1 aminotransferase class I/II-fold pyridoxal phosphate-dependent enzyme [Planctomycetota bacterium]MDW8373890.1 aminotransferase class I/II-fold pyridoxal phosphate-dependent enzyme [Planctomycetota bacterium]
MPHLAIAGGPPLLPQPQPRWRWPPPDDGTHHAIASYLAAHGPLSPRGAEGIIGECEVALATRFGCTHALLCASGTMALYSAFAALGIAPGDEVLCPAITFHATATPLLHLGARVVLVDVEPDTGNIDPAALAAAITPRTVAVVTNAMWGHPVEQEAVRACCDRHRLAWVEDVSHAHGAIWHGRQVGTWGDICCMSLGAEKMLTGGLGGALLTSRRDLYERAVLVGNYLFRSRQRTDGGDISDPRFAPLARTGYGLKLSCHPLAAVVIRHQLTHHFETWIAERHASLQALRRDLADLPGLQPPTIRAGVESMGAWYGFKPWIDSQSLGLSRQRIVAALQAEGIDIDVASSPPLHHLALFNGFPLPNGRTPQTAPLGSFPAAERYASGLLSVPTYTGARDEQRRRELVAAFRKVWEHLDEIPR